MFELISLLEFTWGIGLLHAQVIQNAQVAKMNWFNVKFELGKP